MIKTDRISPTNRGLAKFGAEVLNSILVVLQDICTTSKLTYSKCPHFFKPNPVVCYYIGTLFYSKKEILQPA